MATYNFDTSTVNTREGQRSLLSKTFLYMFLFLMVTVAVSVGISMILQNSAISNQGYITMMSIASFSQIILTFVLMFSTLRQGKSGVIPMTLYAICMGVLISSFSLYLKWWTLASAFGIAALSFGGMALIGAFSKNASGMGMVGFGLLFSVMMVSLFNIFMVLFLPRGFWVWQNIITSVIIVVAINLITAYDVYNIRKISEMGENSSNLALYLAFNLYMDFIVIFIHIVRLIILLGGGNNNQ